MKTFILAGVMAMMSSNALAQTPPSAPPPPPQAATIAEGEAGLTTRTGHDLSVSVGHYTYTEPGDQSISIHGLKIGGEYTGTRSLGRGKRWFVQADVRGTGGAATYDGWCAPYLITPDSGSPNGYALDLGDYSPCSENGDSDWYLEGRGLVGRDFISKSWGVSPDVGLGLRHLSNGTTGVNGFRTDDYLYLPLGLTARTRVAPRRTLSLRLEYDVLLHGWQNTYQSKLGGGEIPATSTAPAFTIDGFTDLAFSQDRGWGLRASAAYQMASRWSVEPGYIHWNVSASDVDYTTATFTVNGITAQQQLGAYEPDNATNEFFVNLGFHF